MPSWEAIALVMESTTGWRHTDFTGRHPENDPITAPLYNFGKGSQALYRQPQGQKQMAVSVRCVREESQRIAREIDTRVGP